MTKPVLLEDLEGVINDVLGNRVPRMIIAKSKDSSFVGVNPEHRAVVHELKNFWALSVISVKILH